MALFTPPFKHLNRLDRHNWLSLQMSCAWCVLVCIAHSATFEDTHHVRTFDSAPCAVHARAGAGELSQHERVAGGLQPSCMGGSTQLPHPTYQIHGGAGGGVFLICNHVQPHAYFHKTADNAESSIILGRGNWFQETAIAATMQITDC